MQSLFTKASRFFERSKTTWGGNDPPAEGDSVVRDEVNKMTRDPYFVNTLRLKDST